MGLIKKLNDITGKIEVFVLATSVLLMAAILIGNVFSRQFFNNSWKWAEEVGQFLVVIITFVGTSYAARKGKHIRMSAIYDALSQRGKKVLAILSAISTAVAMFYLTYLALRYAITMQVYGRVSPALKMPMYYLVSVVAIGFFLTAIQYLFIFILNLKEKGTYLGTEEENEIMPG